MKKLKCKHKGCDKIVEGYNKRHAQFLMWQHELAHKLKESDEDETNSHK